MRPNGSGERAVSPVIGVILVVAIAVILSAIVGGYVFSVQDGTTQEPAPQVNWEYQYDRSADTLTIRHDTGDSLDPSEVYVRVEDGDTEETWEAVEAGSGTASWAASATLSDSGEIEADETFVVDFDAGSVDARDGITIYWRTSGTPEEQNSAVLGRWELSG